MRVELWHWDLFQTVVVLWKKQANLWCWFPWGLWLSSAFGETCEACSGVCVGCRSSGPLAAVPAACPPSPALPSPYGLVVKWRERTRSETLLQPLCYRLTAKLWPYTDVSFFPSIIPRLQADTMQTDAEQWPKFTSADETDGAEQPRLGVVHLQRQQLTGKSKHQVCERAKAGVMHLGPV